jgi:hypothetical protein
MVAGVCPMRGMPGNVGNNFLSNLWRADSENDPGSAALRLGNHGPDGGQCFCGVLAGCEENHVQEKTQLHPSQPAASSGEELAHWKAEPPASFSSDRKGQKGRADGPLHILSDTETLVKATMIDVVNIDCTQNQIVWWNGDFTPVIGGIVGRQLTCPQPPSIPPASALRPRLGKRTRL